MLSRLYSYGVEHVYGVDGDAVIRIRKELETFGKIANITCVHEATAAFSAEAYGRVKKLGCVYLTYNAGVNNSLNAVDEGYLHNSALVIVGGEPGIKFRESNPCLHHHQLRFGDFDDQLNLLAVKLGKDRVKSITDYKTAARDIAALVGMCVRDRLPVYIGIPSDVWDKEIAFDSAKIEKIRAEYDDPIKESPRQTIDNILQKLKKALAQMKHPLLSIGHEVKEFGMLTETVNLAEKLNIPAVSRFNGFGAFPIDHPRFIGVYNGPASIPRNIREITENTADRIDVGVLDTDLNFALQTDTVKLPPASIIFDPREGYVSIGRESKIQCNTKAQIWLIKQLAETSKPFVQQAFASFASVVQDRDAKWKLSRKNTTKEKTIQVSDIAPILNSFLKDKDMPFLADVGDAMFIALGILPGIPSRINYTGNFAAMGIFAGCIGLEHATGRRPLVLTGDGAYCMGETYSFALTGARPIIIILNNGGWSMMRQLRPGATLAKIDPLIWPSNTDFHANITVKTPRELENALKQAYAAKEAFIIDLRLDINDKSELLKNFKDVSTKKP